MNLFLGQVLVALMLFPFHDVDKEPVSTTNLSKISIETLKDSRKGFSTEENFFFRNIEVTGKGGKYKVSGEARPATGEFFYTVEDGHVQLIDETKGKTTSKYPEWETFKITISLDKDDLPKNGVLILNLYERGSKEGEIIHPYPVVLEKFYSEYK